MKRLVYCAAAVLLLAPALLYGEAAPLSFEGYGFSIAPLEPEEASPSPAEGTTQALIMLLPASDGFAPNVNVQIQPFEGALSDYAQLSRRQFARGNIKILKEDVLPGEIRWSYRGMMRGQSLRWYARAVQHEGRVYLVTATAAAGQWAQVGEQLKRCVNSFRLAR